MRLIMFHHVTWQARCSQVRFIAQSTNFTSSACSAENFVTHLASINYRVVGVGFIGVRYVFEVSSAALYSSRHQA